MTVSRRLEGADKGLKTIGGRTFFVGDERRFSAGCRSCLTGTGLSAVRKTNKCNRNANSAMTTA